jgi:hypothetical protein
MYQKGSRAEKRKRGRERAKHLVWLFFSFSYLVWVWRDAAREGEKGRKRKRRDLGTRCAFAATSIPSFPQLADKPGHWRRYHSSNKYPVITATTWSERGEKGVF